MKHSFTRCILCKTPYVDEAAPYVCRRCQENGKAAAKIEDQSATIAAQAAEIEKLRGALEGVLKGFETGEFKRTHPRQSDSDPYHPLLVAARKVLGRE